MKIPQDKRLTKYALDKARTLYDDDKTMTEVLVYLARRAVSIPDHPDYRQVTGSVKQAAKDLKMTQKELMKRLDVLDFWNHYFMPGPQDLGELRLLPHLTHFLGTGAHFEGSYSDLLEYAKKKYPSITSPEGQTK